MRPTRRSRNVCEARSMAAAAAFSHDSLLVPTSAITLYTLSAMLLSFRPGFIKYVRGDSETHYKKEGSPIIPPAKEEGKTGLLYRYLSNHPLIKRKRSKRSLGCPPRERPWL